jgi:hypothetical protein
MSALRKIEDAHKSITDNRPTSAVPATDPRRNTQDFDCDANGNMLEIDGRTNTWEFKGRLVAVANAEMQAEYTYDYTDRRVMKRVWPPPPRPSVGSGAGGEGTSGLYVDKYFDVRDPDVPVKYIWNGNTRVARATGVLASNPMVQRLRVCPGWNLLSLAVTAPHVMRQLTDAAPGDAPLFLAFRWMPATLSWAEVATRETLPAGTVLWLRATTNATLTVTGTYAIPAASPIPAGVSILANDACCLPRNEFLPCRSASLMHSLIRRGTPTVVGAILRLDSIRYHWRVSSRLSKLRSWSL